MATWNWSKLWWSCENFGWVLRRFTVHYFSMRSQDCRCGLLSLMGHHHVGLLLLANLGRIQKNQWVFFRLPCPPAPYPHVLCTLPSVVHTKRLKWHPNKLNNQYLQSHQKIRDREQNSEFVWCNNIMSISLIRILAVGLECWTMKTEKHSEKHWGKQRSRGYYKIN